MRNRYRILPLAILAAIGVMPVFAAKASAQSPPAQAPDKGPFAPLHFRNLGPAIAGGRVTAVVGIPGNPLTYYVGAAAGGVWKTSDGGEHFKPIFNHEASASIGALALAPSNPNLVWVGTGESNIRNDIMDGAGVYLSTDAGKTFKRMGLSDAGQIGQIVVDPLNPDHVLVAALGHAWGPNAERGVFETTDGGKSWHKTLFVDNQTGAIDIAMAPGNPEVLFASTWEVVRHPWNLVDGGKGSGLWRSTDGGASWKQLGEGLPKGPLGRIAVATAPSDPERVYALIETKPGKGLLFVSHDLGDKWSEVSDNHALDVRPFYFSRFAVSPINADKLYFMSFHLMESDDGGKTAHQIDKSVHVDHHALWIDPSHPQRIIQGNDGGAYLSQDGGKSWRFLDGLPIEQDYMVAADGKTPYTLCAGLQDNSGWCGPSSSLADKVVGGNDWFNVVGGDGQYVVPAGDDLIYNDSQDGAMAVFHRASKRSDFVMPYLHGPAFVNDLPPDQVKYRFNWTSPIAVDPQNPKTVYLGGNVVFKSTDAGLHWTPVSDDLTRNDKQKQALSGGPVNLDLSGAETYDTVLSLSVAPSDGQVLWAGTDDGLVQLTRDGGAHWSNVTPSGAPKWARVYQVGVSASAAGTAYVGFDAHELDDRHAYVWRTDNYGKSWTRIDKGLPNAPVFVVREDPAHAGVLVAGTDIGAFLSRDNGGHWSPLQAHLPTVPVFDVKFVQGDLVLATHGRGIFVFDHFAPLAEYGDSVAKQPLHLFTPRAGTEFVRWSRGEGAEPLYTVPNAPDGVVIDYSVPKAVKAAKGAKHGAVTITVRDAAGNLIATRYANAKAGVNRTVWNMRYDGATQLGFDQSEREKKAAKDGNNPGGPAVLPGTYQVTVSADGHSASESVLVKADPNQAPAMAARKTILQHALAARSGLSALNDMLNRVTAMRATLKQFEATAGDDARYADVLAQAKKLDGELGRFKDSIYAKGVQHDVIEDDLKELSDLHGGMQTLAGYGFNSLQGQLPPAALLELEQELDAKVGDRTSRFNALLAGDVVAYNRAAYAVGAPTLMTGQPVQVAPGSL
ncbi:MAG: WD40/YVTN/BNR-like repeat-containing protein [Rhodanobacter sp.]